MTDGMGSQYVWGGVIQGDDGYYPNIAMDTQAYNSPQNTNYNYQPQSQQMPYQYDYIKPQMQTTPNQNSIQDEFFKAQVDILCDEEPMEQGDGQMEYPAGELWPMEKQNEQQQFVPFVGNNNNNNGYIPAQVNPWGQLAPFEDQVQVKVNQEIDEVCKKETEKEKAKGYSAVCLAKKEAIREQSVKLAGNLQDEAAMLEAEIFLSQKHIDFAVYDVLIPCLGDNNSNIDYSVFNVIEDQKEMIIEQVNEEKRSDQELQQKVTLFRKTKTELEKAEFDQKNKDVIPVYVTDSKGTRIASNTTLATRITRKKKDLETCKSNYDAAVHQYKIKRLQRITQLLNDHWSYFRPYLIPILQNPPEKLMTNLNWNYKTEQFYLLQQLLFNPG